MYASQNDKTVSTVEMNYCQYHKMIENVLTVEICWCLYHKMIETVLKLKYVSVSSIH